MREFGITTPVAAVFKAVGFSAEGLARCSLAASFHALAGDWPKGSVKSEDTECTKAVVLKYSS